MSETLQPFLKDTASRRCFLEDENNFRYHEYEIRVYVMDVTFDLTIIINDTSTSTGTCWFPSKFPVRLGVMYLAIVLLLNECCGAVVLCSHLVHNMIVMISIRHAWRLAWYQVC